jgi:hypothetical protein
MDRDLHDVIGDRSVEILVEVIADPRTVREQVLDGHAVVDQWQVADEHRAGGRRQREASLLDQAHDREGREPLGPARDAEPRVDRVRDTEPSMREPVGPGDQNVLASVDAHHAREPGLRGDPVDRPFQIRHATTVASA